MRTEGGADGVPDSSATWAVELARIPGDHIRPQDFALRHTVAPGEPRPGEVVVRADAFGLNAGLRHRLGTGRSTTLGPALIPGDVPRSDAVGTVVASREAAVPVGARVVGLVPWAGLSTVPVAELITIDANIPTLELLTIRGHVGLTAYVALVSVGALTEGETVWISAAAGGVGTCAVQIARALGARVLASAGGAERGDFLRDELGVNHALDRTGDLTAQLRDAAPDGIDLYLDLVGGDHLELALERLRDRGRAVLVGSVGAASGSTLTLDHSRLIRHRLTVSGMSVTDHPQARAALLDLVDRADPPIRPIASVGYGPEALATSFAALFGGDRPVGRAIVDVRRNARPPTP